MASEPLKEELADHIWKEGFREFSETRMRAKEKKKTVESQAARNSSLEQ